MSPVSKRAFSGARRARISSATATAPGALAEPLEAEENETDEYDEADEGVEGSVGVVVCSGVAGGWNGVLYLDNAEATGKAGSAGRAAGRQKTAAEFARAVLLVFLT